MSVTDSNNIFLLADIEVTCHSIAQFKIVNIKIIILGVDDVRKCELVRLLWSLSGAAVKDMSSKIDKSCHAVQIWQVIDI